MSSGVRWCEDPSRPSTAPPRAPADRAFAPYGEIAGGTQRTLRGYAGAGGTIGAFDYGITGQSLSTEGYNATAPRFWSNRGERDGLRAAAVTARAGVTLGETTPEAILGRTRIEGLLRWRENTFGLDNVPRDDPNYTGQDRTWLGYLRAETTLFGAWTTGVRLSGSEDRRRYVNLPDAGSPSSTADNFYIGNRVGVAWDNMLRLPSGGVVTDASLTFGGGWDRESAESAAGSTFFRTTVDARAEAAYGYLGAQARLFGRLDVTAALRLDDAEDYGTEATWRLGAVLGTLDEDFATESMAGDVFLLGTNSWRIRRIEAGKVLVEDAHGAPPSVPFWRGEAPGRTAELSEELARVRQDIAARGEQAEAAALLPHIAREQAIAYTAAGRKALGAVPSEGTVIAERFFDEAGGMQLVIHAPFGARINRAWGLALRKRFCRSFNVELQAAATDNGIVISLTEQHSFPLASVFEFLHPDDAERVLTQALLAAPMFTTRWRWNATRALALPRFRNGKKVPPPLQRMRADDLVAAVFPDQAACAENLRGEIRIPDHPLVKETIRDCLHEAMDLDGLKRVLAAIRDGRIRTLAVETAQASPFSHEILNANPYAFLDDAPLEERRTRAVQLRRTLGADLPAGAAALDPEAIAQVEAESWPVVRDADELHDALLTLTVLPPHREWEGHFSALRAARRAATLFSESGGLWVAAERLEIATRVFPGARFDPPLSPPPGVRPAPDSQEACSAEVLRGWLECTGPQTASALAERLGLTPYLVEAALGQLEAEGQVLRGRFRSADPGETEWCNRRLLARIHHLTIGRLRREIEPVSTTDFMRFLFRWQHLAPGARLHGADGVFQIVRQLQGFECPAAAWESEILPSRIHRYAPELLDELCLSGEVIWGRLSPHPSGDGTPSSRVRPTRAAPIALFLREDFDWLAPAAASRPKLSYPAQEALEVLEGRGALFFAELVRATRRLSSEIEDALWELLAAGLVTADSFENLRALLDPKRRRGEGRGRLARPRHAGGRWALLRNGQDAQPDGAEPFARQLLLRWGVVFRELTAREPLAPPWRDLLVEFRRLEARGEIRGGRFLAGFLGEQFALPEALELLRAVRRDSNGAALPEISPADPLNLTGVVLPGPRLSALATGRVRLV